MRLSQRLIITIPTNNRQRNRFSSETTICSGATSYIVVNYTLNYCYSASTLAQSAVKANNIDFTSFSKTALSFSATYNTNSWGLLVKMGDLVFVNIHWQKNSGNFTSGESFNITIPLDFRLSYTSPDAFQIIGLRDQATLGRLIITGPTNSTSNTLILSWGSSTSHNYLDIQGVYSLVKS